MKKIKVLSLFDGVSVAQQALKELGYDVEYYASEIDKYAIQITQKNHPSTIQVGDVTKLVAHTEPFDLLVGGSPCQNLSIAGDKKGLEGDESKLFFEFIRILKENEPRYFLLENVGSMTKENRDKMSEIIGCQPIMIDANLVSAQDRKRLFWTNIPNITMPESKNIRLVDIYAGGGVNITERMRKKKEGTLAHKKAWGNVRTLNQTSKTLTCGGQSISNSGATNVKIGDDYYTLSVLECERLQSLPDNYTEGVSNTQRYKALGNAFNCAVVKHILSFMQI